MINNIFLNLSSEEISIIKVSKANLSILIGSEKSRKYDLAAHELSPIYKHKLKIITYVMVYFWLRNTELNCDSNLTNIETFI